jgi:hypothetical protein
MVAVAIVVMIVLIVVIILEAVIGEPTINRGSKLEPLPCQPRNAKTFISAGGDATITSTTNNHDLVQADVAFTLRADPGSEPVDFRRMELFVSTNGGWINDRPLLVFDRDRGVNEWNLPGTIPGGGEVEHQLFSPLVCETPANLMLFVESLRAGALSTYMTQVPVRTTGATIFFRWQPVTPQPSPPDVPVSYFPLTETVFLTLQEPLHVVPVAGGPHDLLFVTGQVLNCTGGPIHISHFRSFVRDSELTAIAAMDVPRIFRDALDWSNTVEIDMDRGPTNLKLLGFSFAIEKLPDQKPWQELNIEMCVTDSTGQSFRIMRNAPVQEGFFAQTISKNFKAPVPPIANRVWVAQNGPQVSGFNRNNIRLRNRYAYDFVLALDTPTLPTTFSNGDRNDDFFVYVEKVAVRAMADGTIFFVQDAFGENNGRNAVPGSNEGYVEIRHSNGVFARYRHLRPHDAVLSDFPELSNLAAGNTVQQGDIIGVIGNSGISHEPHLHVECWQFDERTGVFLSVPFGFDNVIKPDGAPLTGVLKHNTPFEIAGS